MNTINQIRIIRAGNEQRLVVTTLLQSEKLPADDLPSSLDNFFIAVEDDTVIGAIGLERYGNYGLLRSIAVSKDHRNKNIASRLVQELEAYAIRSAIDTMYLLTETAPLYFEKKGY